MLDGLQKIAKEAVLKVLNKDDGGIAVFGWRVWRSKNIIMVPFAHRYVSRDDLLAYSPLTRRVERIVATTGKSHFRFVDGRLTEFRPRNGSSYTGNHPSFQ